MPSVKKEELPGGTLSIHLSLFQPFYCTGCHISAQNVLARKLPLPLRHGGAASTVDENTKSIGASGGEFWIISTT